jgi:hypothetical protein
MRLSKQEIQKTGAQGSSIALRKPRIAAQISDLRVVASSAGPAGFPDLLCLFWHRADHRPAAESHAAALPINASHCFWSSSRW